MSATPPPSIEDNGTVTARARVRAIVLAAIVVTALSGCGATAPEPGTPSPAASTAAPEGPGVAPVDGGVYSLLPATHAHVQLTCPVVSAVHYDPSAIPATAVDGAYICTAEPWTDAPDGTPQLVQYVNRIAQGDVTRLLAAYAAPDAEPADEACDSALRDPLIVWLHVAEQITPVFAPRDPCGAPVADADAAYHAVTLQRLLVAREKERHD
jgi:hypothetical protein